MFEVNNKDTKTYTTCNCRLGICFQFDLQTNKMRIIIKADSKKQTQFLRVVFYGFCVKSQPKCKQ